MSLSKRTRRSTPVGTTLSALKRFVRSQRASFEGSSKYWETRYQEGGNSGSGSYNRLAQLKADVINKFVADNRIKEVAELGSGDGAQLKLAQYPAYTGYDVSKTAVDLCREIFKGDETKRFHCLEGDAEVEPADLLLSLDVIYHLVEDDVFEQYMQTLFGASKRFVIIYSSNSTDPIPAPHVKHRKFTDWVEENRRDFTLVQHIPNKYPFDPADPKNTTFADFFIYEKQT